jgi:CHAT domain-containing protein
LPGAAAEAEWLVSAFDDADLRGGRRSASFDPRELSRYGVLHFATHAVIDDQHPWRSGVQIDGWRSPDPLLRATRIASTPLTARLAVLAACESASGRALSGEGVQGLTAAFLSAGVPAVVASLWPVDDRATELLMKEFYRHLGRGLAVPAALSEAQRTLRSRSATADPFYWAGFVVIGEPTTSPALRARRLDHRLALVALGLVVACTLTWGTVRLARTPSRRVT